MKRLTELMGGEVGVHKRPSGTRLHVLGHGFALDALEQQPGYNPLGKGRRILVVDDLTPGRNSLSLKLAYFSFETPSPWAPSPTRSRCSTAAKHIDLVLADEIMPERGGLDLLAALRADSRFAKLPLVLLSLFGAEHALDTWPHRPDAIGSKPIRASRLATLVNGVLTGESPQVAPATAPQPQQAMPTFPRPPRAPGRGQRREPTGGATCAAKPRH